METEGLIEHILVSVAGSLLGIALGWGAGYASFAAWRKINPNLQKVHPLTVLIPWRTVVLGLLLVNYIPIFPIIRVGLGIKTGILSVAYIAFWLTLIFVFQLEQNNQKHLRILSWTRTFSVFSVLLTAHYGAWGGGGLGFAAREQLVLFNYTSAWIYFAWMVGIALAVDLVIATGQFFVVQRATQKERETG